MLTIHLEAEDFWNETVQEFFLVPAKTVRLEHSLISISKWESFYEKGFLRPPGSRNSSSKTTLEWIKYIECMMIGPSDPVTVNILWRKHRSQINDYINSKQTATIVSRMGGAQVRRQVITSELIYYWMIHFHIDITCEKWHLNRLMTLIDVCSAKADPGKMTRKEVYRRNAELNALRKRRLK